MKSLDLSPLMTPKMEAAIAELKRMIATGFPDAAFAVKYGEEPPGVYLIATVDLDDLGAVENLYLDRLVDLQLDEELRLFVIPERPIARSLESMAKDRAAAHARMSA